MSLDKENFRLVCARCGACASHDDDRIDGHCRHCRRKETILQQRSKWGEWVDYKPASDVEEKK